MHRFECRSIGLFTLFAASLWLLAARPAGAQQAPRDYITPRPGVKASLPPNPLPPPATGPTAAPAVPNASTNAGAPEPGYLGVVTDDRQENGAGVRVVETVAGAPAEKSGLKAGDLITGVNGTPVHSETDMIPVLQKLGPGSKVSFQVDRDGRQQTVDVTLGNRPPAGQRRFEKFGRIPEQLPEPSAGGGIGPQTPGPVGNEPGPIPPEAGAGGVPLPSAPSGGVAPNVPNGPSALPSLPPDSSVPQVTRNLPPVQPSRRPLLGVRTRPVTEDIRQRLGLPALNGALVVSRTLGSPAARAGIPLDAVITAVDGRPIASPLDLTTLVAQAGQGREIDITYFYGGSERHVRVRLAEFASAPSGLLGGGAVSAGPIPAPPAPQAGQLPVPDDKTRIDALERRVQQLEHRVDDLEQALRKSR